MHIYENIDNTIIPRHFTESKNGQSRSSTLRDFKKWRKDGRNVLPSVTTIMSILDKPGLLNWKIDQYLLTAWEYDQHEKNEYKKAFVEEYIDTIKLRTLDRLEAAPVAGNDFHKKMEDFYLNGNELSSMDHELVTDVHYAIKNKLGLSDRAIYSPEQYFFSKDGYAGCADLIIVDEGGTYILDYKTKQTAISFKPGKMAYEDHIIQLAAYRHGLAFTDAKCVNVFVCLEDHATDIVYHDMEDELDRALKMFMLQKELYYIKNNI